MITGLQSEKSIETHRDRFTIRLQCDHPIDLQYQDYNGAFVTTSATVIDVSDGGFKIVIADKSVVLLSSDKVWFKIRNFKFGCEVKWSNRNIIGVQRIHTTWPVGYDYKYEDLEIQIDRRFRLPNRR